ncbi:MAG: DUF4240 domain-containing protein [Bacteroidota bacterium]
MKERDFWDILFHATAYNDYSLKSYAHLVELLSDLPLSEIIAFECFMRKTLHRTNHHNVIAVANMIFAPGVGTDEFLYFQCWLILQGPDVISSSIKNPDNLVSILDWDHQPKSNE